MLNAAVHRQATACYFAVLLCYFALLLCFVTCLAQQSVPQVPLPNATMQANIFSLYLGHELCVCSLSPLQQMLTI